MFTEPVKARTIRPDSVDSLFFLRGQPSWDLDKCKFIIGELKFRSDCRNFSSGWNPMNHRLCLFLINVGNTFPEWGRRRWLSGTILCLIAQGSGFESQREHLFFGILPWGEISQEGFAQGLVSPPTTSRYIGSVRIISEAPLVCPNGCWYLLKR
jgi:hypothetical protein